MCLSDSRCGRLQLEDLLIAPLRRITRLPILLKEIGKYSEDPIDKSRIEKVIETITESLSEQFSEHCKIIQAFLVAKLQ